MPVDTCLQLPSNFIRNPIVKIKNYTRKECTDTYKTIVGVVFGTSDTQSAQAYNHDLQNFLHLIPHIYSRAQRIHQLIA